MFRRPASLFLFAATILFSACASNSMDLINPGDDSPRLGARQKGISVSGGGTASSRGWDRRVIVSLAVRNEGEIPMRLAREDLSMRLGLRRVTAQKLVGSDKPGEVEEILLPAGSKASFIAQFSTALAVRKQGKLRLRLRAAGSGETIDVEVPIRLRRPPELLKNPGMMDRAGTRTRPSDTGS